MTCLDSSIDFLGGSMTYRHMRNGIMFEKFSALKRFTSMPRLSVVSMLLLSTIFMSSSTSLFVSRSTSFAILGDLYVTIGLN